MRKNVNKIDFLACLLTGLLTVVDPELAENADLPMEKSVELYSVSHFFGVSADISIKMGRAIAEAGDAQASIAAALREAFGLPTPPAA